MNWKLKYQNFESCFRSKITIKLDSNIPNLLSISWYFKWRSLSHLGKKISRNFNYKISSQHVTTSLIWVECQNFCKQIFPCIVLKSIEIVTSFLSELKVIRNRRERNIKVYNLYKTGILYLKRSIFNVPLICFVHALTTLRRKYFKTSLKSAAKLALTSLRSGHLSGKMWLWMSILKAITRYALK